MYIYFAKRRVGLNFWRRTQAYDQSYYVVEIGIYTSSSVPDLRGEVTTEMRYYKKSSSSQ